MRKELVSAYGKALLLFLLIPWLINFFIPVLCAFPLSLGIGGTPPSKVFLNIYSMAVALLGELCYLLLGKYIEQNIISNTENHIQEKQTKSLKKIYSSGLKDIVLYTLASLTLPLLVYSLHDILSVGENLSRINPFNSLAALIVAPVIEEYLFRKVLYMYCKEYGIRRFVLVSALFFSLIHGYSVSVEGAILFIISFIHTYFFLAELYVMYQNIYIPIQMHICWNLTTIFITIGIFHIEKQAQAIVFTISLFVLLYAIYRIMKIKRLMIAEGPI